MKIAIKLIKGMAKGITTAKQSSGAGFLYEDKVFSWFAASLLAQETPLSNVSGIIKRILLQSRAEGWLLDDLVLIMTNDAGDEFNIPVSIKSKVQFSGSGPNSSLLNELWEQYLNNEKVVFDNERDYLGVVNSSLNSSLSYDLNKLFKAAQSSTGEILEARILQGKQGSFSESQIKILKGFRCPAALAKKHSVENIEVWKLLSRIILLEFDFENASSKDELQLKKKCKDLILNQTDSKADHLYNKLCETRSELAASEGAYVDYIRLINRLRLYHELKGVQQHEKDWEKILSNSLSKIDSIREEIGGKIKLDRNNDLDKLKSVVQNNFFTFILGKSGYGKSVLLKLFCHEVILNKEKVIWLDSDVVESKSLTDYFEISNNFIELVHLLQDQVGYIIIDSIERFRKEEHLRLLFELLSYIDSNKTPWKVLLSCQTDDLDEVIKRFYRINLSFTNEVFQLESIDYRKLDLVLKEFPALKELFKHDHLKEILKNLKYLDLLAFNLSKANNLDLSKSFGESDIIDLIWKEEVENTNHDNGDQRSRFLQLIANIQGEKMSIRVAQSEFNVSDLNPLPSLKLSKILKSVNDKIEFEHDLFSEWARYKLIKSNEDNFKSFIVSKNLLSPLWGKSIRLYGVYLLEKNGNVDDWIKTFTDLDENIPNDKIIQDLLLESVIFSNSAFSFLDQLLGFFIQEEGKILKRFFDRFLIKATSPDPQILKLAKELGGYSESEASIIQRIPIFIFWPPVISFIEKNIESFIPIVTSRITEITQLWLDRSPLSFPYRKNVTMFAYKSAEWIFNFKLNEGWATDGLDEKVYKAMLTGISQLPDEIIELCLMLCRRMELKNPKKERLHAPSSENIFLGTEIRKPKQWSSGPFERVDEAFSTLCLSTDALSELTALFPEKAKEIILALLIDCPKPIFNYDYNYAYDIVNPHKWHATYYGQGPFLSFLNSNPYIGIDTIITLVDFATQQWATAQKYNKSEIYILNIKEYSKEFIGDKRIYFWYRASGNAPTAISCALMALEKFLINEVDNKNDINKYIKYIVANAKSICFIGLLSFIGKYQPVLFFSSLRPILSTFELYRWEIGLENIEQFHLNIPVYLGEKLWNEVRDWNNIPQRKVTLLSAGIQLFLQTNKLDDFYKETIILWQEELDINEKDDNIDVYKRNLIAQFNLENYKLIENKGQTYYHYDEPKELQEILAPFRINNNEFLQKTLSPFRYISEIEDGKKYTKKEVNDLWEKVFIDSNISLSLEKYDYLSNELSSIFGAIALLFEHQDVWINEHPEHITWSIDFTEKVLINAPYNLKKLYMAEGSHSWSAFIAKLLAKIWVTDLKNKKIRHSIGLLCLKSTYDINQLLFKNVSNELKWSDQNFIQLQNLIIEWSIGVYRFFNTKNEDELPKLYEKPLFQRFINRLYTCLSKQETSWINVFAHKRLKEFVNDKTKYNIINWSEKRMVNTYIDRYSRHRKTIKNNKKKPGLDTEMLQHIFSSIPNLNEIDEDIEYQYLLEISKKIVEQLVFENGAISPNCEVIEEYPRDFTLWVLQHISKQIVYIKKEDKPSLYWKPILNYGVKAPYQINIFLQEFFNNNIGKKELNIRFFEEWKEMEEFCSNNENWINSTSWRKIDFEHSLYCVSENLITLWDIDNYAFLKAASDIIMKWFIKNLHNQAVLSRLILLLRKKSGIILLEKGVEVLAMFIQNHTKVLSQKPSEDYVHRKFEHVESLAKTAGYLWENHKDKIKSSSELYARFKEIVTYLVSVNDPIGLELQNRMLEY